MCVDRRLLPPSFLPSHILISSYLWAHIAFFWKNALTWAQPIRTSGKLFLELYSIPKGCKFWGTSSTLPHHVSFVEATAAFGSPGADVYITCAWTVGYFHLVLWIMNKSYKDKTRTQNLLVMVTQMGYMAVIFGSGGDHTIPAAWLLLQFPAASSPWSPNVFQAWQIKFATYPISLW